MRSFFLVFELFFDGLDTLREPHLAEAHAVQDESEHDHADHDDGNRHPPVR